MRMLYGSLIIVRECCFSPVTRILGIKIWKFMNELKVFLYVIETKFKFGWNDCEISYSLNKIILF